MTEGITQGILAGLGGKVRLFDYDVFLSHAAADAAEIMAVGSSLKDAGYAVYLDRVDDPQLDRTKVTPETASLLKRRMRSSDAMVYVVSRHAHLSRWMPWELGFFDGARGKVLVYPLDAEALELSKQQEYLRLFPVLEPGTLNAALAAALSPGALPVLGVPGQHHLFDRADHGATAGYGPRIGRAMANPLDVQAVFGIQAEIWDAWLRLWGLRRP